jgi:hypothetical protein
MAHVTSPPPTSSKTACSCAAESRKSSELTALFAMYQERPAPPFAWVTIKQRNAQTLNARLPHRVGRSPFAHDTPKRRRAATASRAAVRAPGAARPCARPTANRRRFQAQTTISGSAKTPKAPQPVLGCRARCAGLPSRSAAASSSGLSAPARSVQVSHSAARAISRPLKPKKPARSQ